MNEITFIPKGKISLAEPGGSNWAVFLIVAFVLILAAALWFKNRAAEDHPAES